MVNLNISIRKEAYDLLSRLKGENKSFSDVIMMAFEKEKSPLGFFGCLKDTNWEEVEKNIKEFRKDFNKRLK